VRAALGRSLPFYVNGVAIAVYSNVDTIVLSLVASPAEVGYYGAAQSVAGLSLFISPLIGSVLMPLLARAKARSREEMLGILRRSIELVIATILPVVLLVGLGADLWVRRLSGADYGPAAPALTLLAPMFVLTYLTILTATYLLLVDHAWTVTLVSCGSMAVAGALDLLVVPRTWAWLGTGGAGVGAAVAQTATEGLVTLIFLVTIGRGAFDRRSLGTLGKSLLIGGAVVALDLSLRPLGLVRLGLDAALFAALALLSGTVRVGEVRALISEQLQARFARARA
jgi:O-antigen/teichoic acid export membrane protein